MDSWWLLWLVCMFAFLVLWLGYGSGLRKWGPPYPKYIERRRERHAANMGAATTFNHRAWGASSVFVWAAIVVGIFGAVVAILILLR
jgi:hypothetical protein